MATQRFVLEGGEKLRRDRLLVTIGSFMMAPVFLFGTEEAKFMGALLIMVGIGLAVMAFADKPNFILSTSQGLTLKLGKNKAPLRWEDITGYDLRNGKMYLFTEKTQYTLPRTYFKLNQAKQILRHIAGELSERQLITETPDGEFW